VRYDADALERGAVDSDGMHAGALQEAEGELVERRHDEHYRMALSGVALGASLVATTVFPPLVVPLFAGGLAIGALGVFAFWRHWDLLDRLADDRDAYSISEVRAYGVREARMNRRRFRAELIRAWTSSSDPRVGDFVDELNDLAGALENEDLELDIATAVACRRFVSEPAMSPLLDETASREDLRSAINRLLAGFHPRLE
jgi:hypothetical protein